MIKKIEKNACILCTLEGDKEAKAGRPILDWAKRKVVKISALDKSFSIYVPFSIYAHKFHIETKPTFYAC